MKKDFDKKALPPHLIDAQKWELQHNHEDLDEYNLDPPRKVHDPQRVMAPTPFGTVDVEIIQELSDQEQHHLREAQQHERSIEKEFSDLRSIDEVPGAGKEYEAHLKEQDTYRERMTDRFNHMRQRDLKRDR